MHSSTLANGLRVLVQENHSAKVAAIQIWVRVGSADETPPEAGLAHVHEHMLFKGTERRKVGEIASEIEGAGGDINAWTSYDQTVYHVTMASRDFDVGLDILADAVQHSAFDPAELEKELEVVLEELRRGNDTPSRVVSENLFKTAYRAHPYSRPIIGYVDTVKSFTREAILAFYRRWYRPENMCLVVAGDVKEADVLAKAQKLFPPGKKGELPARSTRVKEPLQTELRTIRVVQPIQETHLAMGWHGTEFKHEDTAALDVLSILLGSGDSSRLYRTVRRDLELANDVFAWSYTPEDAGLFSVGANIAGDTVEAAYRAVLKETLRLSHEAPAEAEVEKAKTIILSEAVYSKETVQGMARKIGFYELTAGGPSYEEVYYRQVRETTPERVLAVARKYLRIEGLTVSLLLPTERAADLKEPDVERIAKEVVAELAKEYAPKAISGGADATLKMRLDNGATLVVHEDHSVPLVSVRALGKGGLLAETEADNGVTHLLAELLTTGTSRYTAEQIAERIDATAGGLSGLSGKNSVGLRGDFLKQFWTESFDIFTSCLLEPSFDPRELEREKKAQIEDISARMDNLSAVAFDRLTALMWNQHPYRFPTLGTKESVERIGREQVVAAHQRQLRPDRLTITVVGDVEAKEVAAWFNRRVGVEKAAPGVADFGLPPAEAWSTVPKSTRIAKPKEQAHLVLGFPGLSLYDDRRWPLEVLNSVLGGQGGRLFLELRDKLSLCYSVSAFSVEGLAPGYFAVYMGTAQEKLETAEAGIKKELAKVIDADVTAEELERAKRYLIGAHEVGLQRVSARANAMSYSELYGMGWDDHLRYAARIEAVTEKAVREVAKDLIRFDRVIRSVVEVGTN